MSDKDIFENRVSEIVSSTNYKNPKRFGVYKIIKDKRVVIIENIDSNHKSAAIMSDNLVKLGYIFDYESDINVQISKQFIDNSLKDFIAFIDEPSHKNIQALLDISKQDNIGEYYIYFIYS